MTQLIDLKDRSLAQTADIADAIESIELMADVRDQMQQVAQAFGRMQNWVVQIAAFEPVLNRAMRSLQPLVQLGNLRHMDAAELRQVLRTMSDRQDMQYSGTKTDAAPSTADVPPITESALAN